MAGEDTSATWAVNLVDGTSQAAETAAAALKKLKNEINADKKALADMQRAMKDLQGGTSVNIAQFRELKAKIDAKQQSIATATSSYLNLGGTFGDLKRKSRPAHDAFGELKKQAEGVGGPISDLVGRFDKLKGLLAGGALAAGALAIAAAMLAVAAAAAYATAALLKYGIAQAGARRMEGLRLEGLTKMRNWWGIPAGNAKEMQGAIDKISDSTTLGRDKLEAYTAKLYQMGLRGENLTLALEGTAIKAAVLGDEAGNTFAQWAAGAALAGGSVKRLTDDVKARFGGIAARQVLDLGVQMDKLHANFARLFDGLNLEGLLKGFREVTSLFSQSTITGRALKAVVEGIFQPMIDSIATVGPVVRRFFQGIVIGALMAGIAVLQVRNWFKRTFGDKSIFAGWDAQKTALYLGVGAFAAMAGALVALGLVFAAVGVAIGLFTAVVWAPIAAFIALKAIADEVFDFLGGIDWGSIATGMIDGLVNGITGAKDKALNAIRNLGAELMYSFRSKLGIASPSKLFAELGVQIPRGVEAGVESGTPSARASVSDMIDQTSAESVTDSAARAGTTRGGSAPISVTIGDVYVNSEAKNSAQIAADIKPELIRMFEGVLMELGGSLGST
jgi:hypothetical protein